MPEFRLLLYSYESSAKIAQASAMRVYSQIAERSFIFCKDKQLNRYCQTFIHLKTFSSFFPPFYLYLNSSLFVLHSSLNKGVYSVYVSILSSKVHRAIRVIRPIRVRLKNICRAELGTFRALSAICVRHSQAAESTGLIRAIRDIRVRLSLHLQRPRSLIRVIRDIRVPLTTQATESHGLIRVGSRYYFPLVSGSTTNLVFVSLTRTFRPSLFALHSQTSLPVPTSPPSCISTARCPPQPRYSHRDHLSQPTYP